MAKLIQTDRQTDILLTEGKSIQTYLSWKECVNNSQLTSIILYLLIGILHGA